MEREKYGGQRGDGAVEGIFLLVRSGQEGLLGGAAAVEGAEGVWAGMVGGFEEGGVVLGVEAVEKGVEERGGDVGRVAGVEVAAVVAGGLETDDDPGHGALHKRGVGDAGKAEVGVAVGGAAGEDNFVELVGELRVDVLEQRRAPPRQAGLVGAHAGALAAREEDGGGTALAHLGRPATPPRREEAWDTPFARRCCARALLRTPWGQMRR